MYLRSSTAQTAYYGRGSLKRDLERALGRTSLACCGELQFAV